MYNTKILSKALSDIAKKESGSKYKICAVKGNIWIFYLGVAMYPTTNYLCLSIDNPDLVVDEKTVNYIYDNIKNEQEIQPTNYIYSDLTEFITEKGKKVYCKTKLLKDAGFKTCPYCTYVENKYICIYDSPKKNLLYAVISPIIKRGENN